MWQYINDFAKGILFVGTFEGCRTSDQFEDGDSLFQRTRTTSCHQSLTCRRSVDVISDCNNSGAMNSGVPCNPLSMLLASFEIPKSHNLMYPSSQIRMLSGFRSLGQ